MKGGISGRRIAVFAVMLVIVVAWVAATDGEYASAARHFVRALLRALF